MIASSVASAFLAQRKAAVQAEVAASSALAFRAFMASPHFCRLALSPAIAAIADASEGRATGLDDDTAIRLFGCETSLLPQAARRTVIVRAGGRGGKTSRLLATKAIHSAWTVPLPNVMPGENARALIIAPDKALALQALGFVRGYIKASPALSAALERDTQDCITLRRPHDGRVVDITIGAATRGGKAARGRSLVFVGMDEAAFFYADDGYTVTDKEIYRASIQRVVPGGQVWIVSTPWIEGVGVMEERLSEDFGKHEKSLVAQAPTRLLNPQWDPTGEIERDMREDDPENAAREIDALPLSAGTKFFFPPDIVKLATVTERANVPLEPLWNVAHFAGVDLGFRKNSSALAIARREGAAVVLAKTVEMRPQKGLALKPSEVCASFVAACREYGAKAMRGDLHYADTAREELEDTGVQYSEWVPTAESKAEAFTEFRRRMAEGKLNLPKDARLLSQIRQTTAKVSEGGTIKISLPKQGAAHGDLLMAVVLACVQVPIDDKPRRESGAHEESDAESASAGW